MDSQKEEKLKEMLEDIRLLVQQQANALREERDLGKSESLYGSFLRELFAKFSPIRIMLARPDFVPYSPEEMVRYLREEEELAATLEKVKDIEKQMFGALNRAAGDRLGAHIQCLQKALEPLEEWLKEN